MAEPLYNIPIEYRWRNQLQPVPIVIAIIQRALNREPQGSSQASYLLIRRQSGPYRHYWALVGGKWDFGESLSEAVLREINEETGLESNFRSLLGVLNERVELDEAGRKGAAHFLIFVCSVDAGEGEALEQDEGAVAWFTLPEIHKMNAADQIIPSDYAMISQFVGGRPLPHFEIEMRSVYQEDEEPGPTTLVRFDLIE